MSRVFISYRRDDTRWVARALKNKLSHAMGEDQIFMDIDSIDPGVDFVEALEQTISQVDAVIAVIGPAYLTITDGNGNRRIDDPNDLVRLEVATALKRNIRVIPLLEAGTPLPTEDELPSDLKPLARRNAVEVGEVTFEQDVDRIVDSLERLWQAKKEGKKLDTKRGHVPGSVNRDDDENAQSTMETLVPSSLKNGSSGWGIPLIVGIALLAIAGLIFAFSGAADFFGGPRSELPPSTEKATSPSIENPAEPSTEIVKRAPESAAPPSTESAAPPSTESVTPPSIENPTPPTTEDAKPAPSEVAVSPSKDPAPAADPSPASIQPLDAPAVKVEPPAVDGMVWISPGTFLMGSPANEKGRRDDETQHEVELTEGFYLGQFEVTQELYEAVMKKNPSANKKNDAPVENVSWNDALEFCKTLNRFDKIPAELGIGDLPDGYVFSLPTEAQWEYACRAGTVGRLKEEQLYAQAVMYEKNTDGWNSPKSVGSRKPNAWGLHDMLGNVEEWCLDVYGPYPGGAVSDPLNDAGGDEHVMRGGSYNSSNVTSHNCRPAVRDRQKRSGASPLCGMRLAAVRKT